MKHHGNLLRQVLALTVILFAFVQTALPQTPTTLRAKDNRTTNATIDNDKILAAHYLRRVGFGPNAQDMALISNIGFEAYLKQQLEPGRLDDSRAERRLPPLDLTNRRERFLQDLKRWVARMAFSNRQLQEKMTLFFHELFSVSANKVPDLLMIDHEALLRRNSLANFRTILLDIARDNAMLIFLDNNNNNGRARDEFGNRMPPNVNFARELLQIYTIGTIQLNMDGTAILDATGRPLPAYLEMDVRELARALTGWNVGTPNRQFTEISSSIFDPNEHDESNKMVLGQQIVGRVGPEGAKELDNAIDIIMQQPSLAPNIAKQLIFKFATETPSPAYVERVATVFKNSNGDMRQTMFALFTDPEFTAPSTISSQFKEPVEYFVGLVRAYDNQIPTLDTLFAIFDTGQPLLVPESVFSFYRPGEKRTLLDSDSLLRHDNNAGALLSISNREKLERMVRQKNLTTPDAIVDFFATQIFYVPLKPETRKILIEYLNGETNPDKVLGMLWLFTCSPDYQRN
jgi:uncharacterized protein (DUF1800 family)